MDFVLINAIKEQQETIESLEDEVETLKTDWKHNNGRLNRSSLCWTSNSCFKTNNF